MKFDNNQLKKLDSVAQMMTLYGVTDRRWTAKQTLYDQVYESIQGGITCLQLREKDLQRAHFIEEAERIVELCKNFQIPLIINDDVELALHLHADGVHVGQSDMAAKKARKQLGSNMILGVSARTVDQAMKAEADGADYIGTGAVFATDTKKDAKPLTHNELKAITQAVSIPVVAIGGISKENIHLLKGTGVSGVAVVSAIFSSCDIRRSCRELLAMSMDIKS